MERKHINSLALIFVCVATGLILGVMVMNTISGFGPGKRQREQPRGADSRSGKRPDEMLWPGGRR